VSNAFEALREAIVNRVLLARGCGPGVWLAEGARRDAEEALKACRPNLRRGGPSLSDGQQRIGNLWAAVCNARNELAHAGMKPQPVKPKHSECQLRTLLGAFEGLHAELEADWRLEGLQGHGGAPR
jgi:hypothetical protein